MRSAQLTTPLDDELHEVKSDDLNPEALLLQKVDAQMLRQAVEELPLEFHEVLVLRELDEMSYKQIAVVADLPIGTVMSRLTRARKRLQQILTSHTQTEVLT